MHGISLLSITARFECMSVSHLQRGRREAAQLQAEISMVATGDFWREVRNLGPRQFQRVVSSEQKVAPGWLRVTEFES